MKRVVPSTGTLSAGVDWKQWAASSPPGSELNRRLAELLAVSDVPIEHYRERGTLVVRAELPGLDPERDVEIMVCEGDLTIRAHRRQPDGRPDQEGFHSEFVYGAFARSLTIPSDVCAGAVRAAYHDGILEIRIDLNDNEASVRVPVDRT